MIMSLKNAFQTVLFLLWAGVLLHESGDPAPVRRLDPSPPVYDIALQRELAAAKAAVLSTPSTTMATNASSWLDSNFTDLLHGGLPLPLALRRRLRDLAAGEEKDVQVADLYGGIYDYAYYFVSVLVGTPPQRQSVILDSGSSLLGFPCSDCPHCGKQHIDRGFNFAASTTAQWISCEDSRCLTKRCGNRSTSLEKSSEISICRYVQSYSEGSSIEGAFFSDVVALGEERDHSKAIRFDYIGCHDRETNLFTTQKASGIVGVSYPKRGKQPTLIDSLFAAPAVDTKVFAICAAEEGGRLSVGGFDSTNHRASRTKAAPARRLVELAQRYRHDSNFRANEFRENAVIRRLDGTLQEANSSSRSDYLRIIYNELANGEFVMEAEERLLSEEAESAASGAVLDPPAIAWTTVTSSSAYQIEVKRIEIVPGTKASEAPPKEIATAADIGPVIVDSGTTFSYLATPVFRSFIAAMDESCVNSDGHCTSRVRTSSDQLCWQIKSADDFEYAPSFLLTLGSGAVVEWRPESYLHRRGRTDQWCLAVDDNMSRQTILGMSFLKQQEVVFDRERDMVGFVRAACHTVKDKDRPAPPTPAPQIFVTSRGQSLAEQNWVNLQTDPFVVIQTVAAARDTDFLHSKSGGYNPYVMWAAGGLAVSGCVATMVAITRRSLQQSNEYAPAPVAPPPPPSFAPFDHVQVITVRPDGVTPTDEDALAEAIRDELQLQQQV